MIEIWAQAQEVKADNSGLYAIGLALLTVAAFKLSVKYGMVEWLGQRLGVAKIHLGLGLAALISRVRQHGPIRVDFTKVRGNATPTGNTPGNTPGTTPGNGGNGDGTTPGNGGNGSGNTSGTTPAGVQDTSWGYADDPDEAQPPTGYSVYRPNGTGGNE